MNLIFLKNTIKFKKHRKLNHKIIKFTLYINNNSL